MMGKFVDNSGGAFVHFFYQFPQMLDLGQSFCFILPYYQGVSCEDSMDFSSFLVGQL